MAAAPPSSARSSRACAAALSFPPPALSLPPPFAMWRLGRPGRLSAALAASSGGWYESLSRSEPVRWAEEGLVWLQEATGLPWWAAISCGTGLLRTAVTLPLAAHQGRILAKLENLQPEVKALAERLRYEVSVCGRQRGWTEKVARFHFQKNLRRIVTELYVRDNCHPFKATLLAWVQVPMWVCVSVALRNCSVGAAGEAVQEQFSSGGALWFTDLTAPDPTWILPVSLGLLNLLIVEVFASQKMEVSRFQKLVTNLFRVLSVVMVPVAATVPAAVAWYWLSSSTVGLSHNLLLLSPTFRSLCRIPRTRSRSSTPYRDLLSALAATYSPKR